MNKKGRKEGEEGEEEKGLVWKLPQLKSKQLGKLGPAFGIGAGCGLGFGIGLLGGTRLSPHPHPFIYALSNPLTFLLKNKFHVLVKRKFSFLILIYTYNCLYLYNIDNYVYRLACQDSGV